MINLNNNNILKTTGLSPQMVELKMLFGASVSVDSGVQTLVVGMKYGKGTVEYVDFNNGISVTQYDLILFNDCTFKLHHSNKEHLYFFYGLEGLCYHNFLGKEKITIIEELRTAILGASKHQTSEITIKKGIQFSFSIISIDKSKYLQTLTDRYNTPLESVKSLSKAFKVLNSYVYQCTHNLKIAKQLRILKRTSNEFGITGLVHLESHFQIILSIHVEQFYKEVFEERVQTNLSKTELQKIREITEFIIDKPMLQHSIKSLCEKAILSPVKLQEGFRCTHGTTVSNYIKNVRVGKSRDLLMYSDYNVSEIAYMVGFTSRSYFCKIFKEKYGSNATAYRRKFKNKYVSLEKA